LTFVVNTVGSCHNSLCWTTP